jgi:hypothetical protein
MKSLRPSETSYILQAQFEGKSVLEILRPEEYRRQQADALATELRELVRVAVYDQQETIDFMYAGRKYTIAVSAIQDLESLHNIDAVVEVAWAVTQPIPEVNTAS